MMKVLVRLVFLLTLSATAGTFAFAPSSSVTGPGSSRGFSSSSAAAGVLPLRSTDGNDDNKGSTAAESLKTELLQNIATLNQLQDEDGKISIDFGVKGGEIDEKSRAPKKLDFYTVSKRVGEAADVVFDTVNKLSKVNPTKEATAGFGKSGATVPSPLNGTWQLLFSTAADANFSRDSKRGDAKAMNIVDAGRERITNVIKFAPKDDGTPKAVEELRVKLSAKAEGSNRVNLVFKYVAVKFTKLFFLPIRWTLYIPVPAPTISKFIIFFANLKNKLFRRKKEPATLPKAFFDVLYLDKDLRVHKTGEDNFFVQARPEWKAAWEIAGK